MFKFISSLRSKYHHREMQKGFNSVFDESRPIGEKIGGFIAAEWKWLITITVTMAGVAAAWAKVFL